MICSFCILIPAVNEVAAGGLSIWPVRVHLPADGTVQEIQVSNPGDEASYVQVTAVEWHEAGQTDKANTVQEILAVPPVFELAPNSSQLVRLVARDQGAKSVERAYRLVVTEVPRTAGLVPNTLAIAARMTLPVFVRPDGAQPSPVWSLERNGGAKPDLVLANKGNAHIKINEVTLFGAENEVPDFAVEQGSLIFAGREERWSLDIDLAELRAPITVRAETTTGPIEAVVSLPGT
jgi:fimbrial chaperone protein